MNTFYNITVAVRFYALVAAVSEDVARHVCARIVAHLLVTFGSTEAFDRASGRLGAFDDALFAMLTVLAEASKEGVDIEALCADYAHKTKWQEWFASTPTRGIDFFQNVAAESYDWVVLDK